ncbi:DUF559 domain-containing protein [Microbacteriaceae bacterium VKM Ac-2854]|nr:DUF559 domain-containing protein [Microbacteriaceae bacterium VKM Ac-2854]
MNELDPSRILTSSIVRDGEMSRRAFDGLARPFRGLRSEFEPITYRERAEALSAAFRDADFFSHTTAAVIRGLQIPAPSDLERLHVSVHPPARAMRRVGVKSHHLWDEKVRIDVIDGLPVTDALSTFCQLGDGLSLDDLVAVGDSIVLRPRYPAPDDPRPFATLDELVERATYFRGRGGRRAREAAALVREGAESRMESLLRLLIVRRGLPEPALNVDLFDADGTFVARADLYYKQFDTVVEYDGDQHRSSKHQNERDLTRVAAIQALGKRVIRVRDAGVFEKPDATIHEIQLALRRGGWSG